jgi:hypothetical protein
MKLFQKAHADIFLLALLCATLFVIPLLPADSRPAGHNLLYSLVLLSSTFCLVRKGELMLKISGTLIALQWISIFFQLELLYSACKFLSIFYFIFIVAALISQTVKSKIVTTRVIVSSVNGYLLLGLIFSLLVALLSHFQPGAYNFGGHDDHFSYLHEPIVDYTYYAFTVFATVGYGDLLPLKPAAKALSVLASVSGQLYLTILIAMLVGKFISTESSSKS